MPTDPSLCVLVPVCSVAGRLSPEMRCLRIKIHFVGKPESGFDRRKAGMACGQLTTTLLRTNRLCAPFRRSGVRGVASGCACRSK
jgi:hypothetical protein